MAQGRRRVAAGRQQRDLLLQFLERELPGDIDNSGCKGVSLPGFFSQQAGPPLLKRSQVIRQPGACLFDIGARMIQCQGRASHLPCKLQRHLLVIRCCLFHRLMGSQQASAVQQKASRLFLGERSDFNLICKQ